MMLGSVFVRCTTVVAWDGTSRRVGPVVDGESDHASPNIANRKSSQS